MNEPPLPRFRIVLELSFRDADPRDPSAYGELFERLRRVVETDPTCNCTEVMLREALTIPADEGDYDDWRRQRGIYGESTWPAESTGRVRALPSGPVEPVDWTELRRVWELERSRGDKEAANAIAQLVTQSQSDSQSAALLARVLLLKVLEERGLLSRWQEQGKTDVLLQRAASLPIEKWNRAVAESFIRDLEREA